MSLFSSKRPDAKAAERLTDLEATVAAIDRSQAMIEFQLDGTISYRDDVFVSADNRLEIPGYWLANASIGWTSTSGRVGLRVWARNLFNEDYYANRTEQALGDIQYLAPPRTFGITASLHL